MMRYNEILAASAQKQVCTDDLIDKDLEDHLRLCKYLKPPTDQEIEDRSVELGEVTRQKTLVLDMDETLIHAIFEKKGLKE